MSWKSKYTVNQIRCTQSYWTSQAVNKIKHTLKGGKKLRRYILHLANQREDRETRFSRHNFQWEREIGTGEWQEQQERQNKGRERTARNRAFTGNAFSVPDVALVRPGSFSSTLHDLYPWEFNLFPKFWTWKSQTESEKQPKRYILYFHNYSFLCCLIIAVINDTS